MKKTSAVISIVIAISAGALLTGCVAQPPRPSEPQYTQYYDAQGTIQDIELISTGAAQTTGAGAVGGAIIGGILGHQVGKGTGKTLAAHYAHLLVHGTLHAQGWDHETSEEDAQEMEDYETAILQELGYPDPYAKD